ncbi:MAG: glycosyltransferase, partial [Paludibacteraceae bacterium]
YYLNGHDPMFGKSYYDLLIGMDATVFPSYYEPWGYTPLESVAFHVPTITTTLAGFGLWAEDKVAANGLPSVTVIVRNDSNYYDVVDQVARRLVQFVQLSAEETEQVRQDAAAIAKKAEWRYFFKYYRQAYDIALKNIKARQE